MTPLEEMRMRAAAHDAAGQGGDTYRTDDALRRYAHAPLLTERAAIASRFTLAATTRIGVK